MDLDPNCDQGLNETIYDLDYYGDSGNGIETSQVDELSGKNTETVYSGAFHFYDADNNCDGGREPITGYNNSGPSGNSLNVIPTRGSPNSDATHVICGGGNSGSSQTIGVDWQTVMAGGIPNSFALQSGSGDTGCWNCSGYSPGYGSTVEFNQTFFWVNSPENKRDLVMSLSFDDKETCDLTSTELCLNGKSVYELSGNPENFDDNLVNTGSGWVQETPLNRPTIRDYSTNSHTGTFYGGNHGELKNFNFSESSSGWSDGIQENSALKFDGQDDLVSIDFGRTFNNSFNDDVWTMSLYFRPIGSLDSSTWSDYVEFPAGDGGRFRIEMDGNENDTLAVYWSTEAGTGGNPSRNLCDFDGLSQNNWYFLTLRLDMSQNGDGATCFVNGDISDSTSKSNLGPFEDVIGKIKLASYPNKEWAIDSFRIHDRPLEKTEIAGLQNGELLYDDVLGRWNFEASDRKTVYDTSSLSREGVLGTEGTSLSYSEYGNLGRLNSDEFTISIWTDLSESRYFDDFSKNTSEKYFVEEYNNRGSGQGFIWRPNQGLVESDTSNDDINLLKSTDLEWPLVYTEARSDDNDGVGVAIDNGTSIYEAVVTNDHPGGSSGIKKRTTGDSDNLVDTEKSYNVGNWHRIGLEYNDSHLRMFVDGSLQAIYEVGYLEPENVGIVSDANNPSSKYRYLETYDGKGILLGDSTKTFAISRYGNDVRGYYNGKYVQAPTSNGLSNYLLRYEGTRISIFRDGRKYGEKLVSGILGSRELSFGERLEMDADEVRIYNRSLSKQEIQRLAFQ